MTNAGDELRSRLGEAEATTTLLSGAEQAAVDARKRARAARFAPAPDSLFARAEAEDYALHSQEEEGTMAGEIEPESTMERGARATQREQQSGGAATDGTRLDSVRGWQGPSGFISFPGESVTRQSFGEWCEWMKRCVPGDTGWGPPSHRLGLPTPVGFVAYPGFEDMTFEQWCAKVSENGGFVPPDLVGFGTSANSEGSRDMYIRKCRAAGWQRGNAIGSLADWLGAARGSASSEARKFTRFEVLTILKATQARRRAFDVNTTADALLTELLGTFEALE